MPTQALVQTPSFSEESSEAVNHFLQSLDHPMKDEIRLIRQLILNADSRISEGMHWNTPNFRTHHYFATTHLHLKQGLGVILHLGPKVRALREGRIPIDDPTRQIRWLTHECALIEFQTSQAISQNATAFQNVIRQWIAHV